MIGCRGKRIRRPFGGGLFVDDLAHFIQAFVYFSFGALEALLTQIDGVSQEVDAFLNALGVAAFLEFDSFALEEAAHVVEKLIFVDRFHSWSLSLGAISPMREEPAITDRPLIYKQTEMMGRGSRVEGGALAGLNLNLSRDLHHNPLIKS
jgi:hypothetical protein